MKLNANWLYILQEDKIKKISVRADGSVKLIKSIDASGAISIIRVMIRDYGDGGGLSNVGLFST